MLKSLPQSGWFHPHPGFNRVAVVMLIVAPILSIPAYFSLARQSQVKIDKSASESGESKDLSGDSPSAKLGATLPVTQTTNRSSSVLSQSKISNKKQDAIKLQNMLGVKEMKESTSTGLNRSAIYDKEVNHPKSKNLPNQSISTGVIPSDAGSSQILPTEEQVSIPNGVPADPINSPHPIPWKWIVMTQEAIGG